MEAFGKQAALVLGDPALETAKESVIRKRAKERIEAIKVELQTGALGPMALDKQFGPVWVRHALHNARRIHASLWPRARLRTSAFRDLLEPPLLSQALAHAPIDPGGGADAPVDAS